MSFNVLFVRIFVNSSRQSRSMLLIDSSSLYRHWAGMPRVMHRLLDI